MTYTRLRSIVFVIGTIVIAVSAFLPPISRMGSIEVAAQLLFVVVLAGALYRGRDGGFLAALLAIAVYAAMRYSDMHSDLDGELLTALALRAAGYATVGVVGGDAWARTKYLFARFESDAMVDPDSGVYSARYAAAAIASGVNQWQRYRTDYSVVRVAVAPSMLAGMKPSRRRQTLRQIAGQIRGDIRVVDDIAVEAPGAFLVMLPRTDASGAAIVATRLVEGLQSSIIPPEQTLSASILSAATEAHTLRRLTYTLDPSIKPVPAAAVPAPETVTETAAPRPQAPVA